MSTVPQAEPSAETNEAAAAANSNAPESGAAAAPFAELNSPNVSAAAVAALAAEAPSARVLFDAMHAASRKLKAPTLDERLANLEKLQTALIRNRDEFVRAISADFGNRSKHETIGAELFIVVSAIRNAREHLADWMHPEERAVELAFFPGRAEVVAQPVGVVGIVAPWNYPMQLALAPLVGALAAGNRALIKPSELTPQTAALLARMLGDIFTSDHVAVVQGDAQVGAEFTQLPFDHLVFTGSTRVGKLVMKAAAENLTPVTLELGGKSPAIVAVGFNMDTAAERILFGKLLNAGQTCIAPDYVLVPKSKLEAFVTSTKKAIAKLYPTLEGNPDYTSIVNATHHARLQNLLDEAKAAGAELVPLNPGNEQFSAESRKLCPTLVLGATDAMAVLQEEIFGPILPIVAYDELSDAIAYVNARPRPLALYYFDHDDQNVERVMSETISGGVSVNETIAHIAQESLPFGGIGPSGMGHYHGKEGFLAFSKLKPIFYQSRLNATGLVRPPYTTRTDLLLKVLVGS